MTQKDLKKQVIIELNQALKTARLFDDGDLIELKSLREQISTQQSQVAANCFKFGVAISQVRFIYSRMPSQINETLVVNRDV